YRFKISQQDEISIALPVDYIKLISGFGAHYISNMMHMLIVHNKRFIKRDCSFDKIPLHYATFRADIATQPSSSRTSVIENPACFICVIISSRFSTIMPDAIKRPLLFSSL